MIARTLLPTVTTLIVAASLYALVGPTVAHLASLWPL